MTKEYSIGLDIGTNSVGWSVIGSNNDLIKKKMKIQGNTKQESSKKNFWGVRLFEEGHTAEDTRLKRTTRRRYIRRKNRLNYLKQIFEKPISKIDEHFFERLGESYLVISDKKYEPYPIFGAKEKDKDYHKQFPTIYHVRKKLADFNEKADLRLVYLACAHILKYRGHFLIEGSFSTNNVSVNETFSNFLKVYNQIELDKDETMLEMKKIVAIEEITNKHLSRSKKSELILAEYPEEKANSFFGQLIKLIVGNQGNFKKVFNLTQDVKLQFSKEDYESNLDELLGLIGDEFLDLFQAAQSVYEAIELTNILSTTDVQTKAKLSSSMIERYQKHQEDLKEFKKYIKKELPEYYQTIFEDTSQKGYAGYIQGDTSQVEFYKFLKKIIPETADSLPFLKKIENEEFLRKQRTYDNGVIPNQIHLEELKAILTNQAKYYPFLKENQPKIEQIMTFRIPYYVGPLATNGSRFSWVVRKREGAIRPWNINEKVDMSQSAVQFIERMTNEDLYLPNEKVLPKNSLIYQRFTVFNELTKVQYMDERNIPWYFSGEEKLSIFNDLFKNNRKITKKKLIEYVQNKFHMRDVSIVKGIEESFNATYSTYHDLLKQGIPKDFLEDSSNEGIIEDIIKKLTIFEDKKMLREQLFIYNQVLPKQALRNLEKRHYTGWGRLSKKLLIGIKDQETHKTILDYLIEDDGYPNHLNRNFMQLINDNNLSFKSTISEAQRQKEFDNQESLVANLPGSPALKKGILNSLKIVDEIVAIMGRAPKNIVIEMARENSGSQRTKSRLTKIEKSLKELGSDLLEKEPTTNAALQNKRLLLYYLQNGRDMYTGNPLDITNLSMYDIDHIIPQSFITDDSIDNIVLVSSKENRGKKDDIPSIEVVRKNKQFWQQLEKCGAMTERKLANLTKAERGGLTEADKSGFVYRQLVETRQITKHVARILDEQFNTIKDEHGNKQRKVNVITLKASLTSQFRNMFDLYKLREVNDYHHAHDAYLNAVVGTTLLKAYPNLKGEFVYGEIPKQGLRMRMRSSAKLKMYTNIMKIFNEEKGMIDDNGEIIWSAKDIKKVKQVLGYRQINIVKKVEQQKGKFHKETIYPRGESNKLIPIKQGLNPEKYGGYKEPVISLSVLIEYKKGKKAISQNTIIGIPLMKLAVYNENKIKYLEKSGYVEPRILVELPKYSLFENKEGKKRMLASATELQKGNQLVLDYDLVELLHHSQLAIAGNQNSLHFITNNRALYSKFMEVINSFSEVYIGATTYLAKINQLFEENKQGNIQEIAKASINLLKFTRFGASMEFDYFGKSISRYRYTKKSDMDELFDGILIYQSVTGLYETKVEVSKL